MRLYIAEKPSLGRAIADVLPKPHEKGDGYIRVANGDELRKRYASQLTIYREALATLTGEPVKETYIYSFRLREAVPIK